MSQPYQSNPGQTPEGQPPQQWTPPTPPRQPRKRRRWPWLVGGAVAVFVLAGLINGQKTAVTTPTVVPAPAQTWTAAPAATPAASVAPSQQQAAAPRTTFGGGTWEVGVDIQPGKYKTTGPNSGGSCYWARLKNTDGTFDSIISNGNTEGPTTVTIGAKDAAFQTTDCTWTKVG